MKMMQIGDRLYTVVTREEYAKNPELYNPKSTALEVNGRVLPIRNSGDSTPGIYYDKNSIASLVVKPDNEEAYSSDRIIDLSSSSDNGELLNKYNLVRSIEAELMVNSDDILSLTTTPADTPEMSALKTAINSKRVNKHAYEDRFEQFQNDMRLLKGNSITLGKLITLCNGFDISCTLTLRDKPVAMNPMDQEITIDLTEGRPNKNEPT